MIEFGIRTERDQEFVDISARIGEALASLGADEGYCVVFCPHTTAGLTVNENADPDVRSDMLLALDKAVAEDARFRHAEGNSAAHVKASLMGASLFLPVKAGRLALGTWQGVYLCEFDGPRRRSVSVGFIRG